MAGGAAQATDDARARHQRAHADAALRAGDRGAGVRHARPPRARRGLPWRRHRRGDERDARDRRGVPRAQGAPPAPGRGGEADPLLWTEERVNFEGEYDKTQGATIYDRPDEPVPIFIAASGPLAAKLAGRVGDGFICTSGKEPELYEQAAGATSPRAPQARARPAARSRMIEMKVSYDSDREAALDEHTLVGGAGAVAEQKEGVEDPIEMERLADANARPGGTRFICSDDPDEVVEGSALRRARVRGARPPRTRARPGALPRAVLRRRAAEAGLTGSAARGGPDRRGQWDLTVATPCARGRLRPRSASPRARPAGGRRPS